ncbi:MAG: SET domain-containing protein-lysine N-methyltransferase [Candidatus Gracilibacteria bacterium]|jgi:hypothetical protein
MIETKSSNIHGKGVFATEKIPEGKMILEIDDSHIIGDPTAVPEAEHNYIDSFDGNDILWMEPERYINHSCEPNVYLKTIDGKRKVLAMKDIQAGDELFFDYRIGGYGEFTWECHCGASSCSKLCHIDFFKLPSEKQREYLPYLDEWFLKKFKDRF